MVAVAAAIAAAAVVGSSSWSWSPSPSQQRSTTCRQLHLQSPRQLHPLSLSSPSISTRAGALRMAGGRFNSRSRH
jgi:hypothetical protein